MKGTCSVLYSVNYLSWLLAGQEPAKVTELIGGARGLALPLLPIYIYIPIYTYLYIYVALYRCAEKLTLFSNLSLKSE